MNKIKCVFCGTEEKMVSNKNNDYVVLPKDWKSYDKYEEGENRIYYVCPHCEALLQKLKIDAYVPYYYPTYPLTPTWCGGGTGIVITGTYIYPYLGNSEFTVCNTSDTPKGVSCGVDGALEGQPIEENK